MTTRFAIVGFGNIGRRHAAHILQQPGATLAGVCDVNPEVRAQLPSDVPFFSSLEDLFAGVEADVLCVCTPNYLHEPHAIAALDRGWHAVVEKPMALSTAECDRMIAAADRAGKLIFAVKQNRYNPPVQAVKGLLDAGRLGTPLLVQVNGFWNRNDAYYAESPWRGKKATDGGCLFTQFSHFVDILYYLNGPLESTSGATANFLHRHNTEFEDTGVFAARAVNGSLVSFNFTTCAHRRNMEGAITVFGERGTVKIGGQYLNTIEYQSLDGEPLPEIRIEAKANDYGRYEGSMSNHDRVIQNVVDALQHGMPVMTGAAEGRDVVRMIEQLYAGSMR